MIDSEEQQEKTEVPQGDDETAMESTVQAPALTGEARHALYVLLVKLADRCLGHAHAKEQPDEPNPFPRITVFADHVSFPHYLSLTKHFFSINRALEEAATALKGMLADKPFVASLLLEWFANAHFSSSDPKTTLFFPLQRGVTCGEDAIVRDAGGAGEGRDRLRVAACGADEARDGAMRD